MQTEHVRKWGLLDTLATLAQSDDAWAKNELMSQLDRFFGNMAYKSRPRTSAGLQFDDVKQMAIVTGLQLLGTWDGSRSGYLTYLMRHCGNHLARLTDGTITAVRVPPNIRQEDRRRIREGGVAENDVFSVSISGLTSPEGYVAEDDALAVLAGALTPDDAEARCLANEVWSMVGSLSEKQQKVLRMYFEQDLSMEEIAEENGVTRQAVATALHRGVEKIRKLVGSTAKMDMRGF